MYTEFYGLKEKPFNLTPSPRFIYMSEGHKEAMALLTYGVTERKGFILLTGEVGTGKTTMIHSLINNLDSSVEYVYLVNPILTPQEFIDYLAFSSFKKRIHFKSKADFLLEFEDFLRNCFQQQKIFILIIDEAHKLSFELLEEIRLLSNMEFAEEKLINIFLVGQPELNNNLSSPKGRATLQRIGIRYDIPPLGLKETGEYIETRLQVAGALKKDEIFQKDAIEAIYNFSQGYPRTINIIADNAMLLGYSRDKKSITSSMIEESYNAMKLDGSFLEEISREEPVKEVDAFSDIHSSHPFKWTLVSCLVIAIAALIVFMFKTSSMPGFLTFTHKDKSQETSPADSSLIKDQIETRSEMSADHTQDTEAPANNLKADIGHDQALTTDNMRSNALKKDINLSSGNIEENRSGHQVEMQAMELTNLQIFPIERDSGFSKSIHAKEGDTLTRLSEKVYGTSGEEEFALLKKYNPNIKDVDQIEVGQRISFPVLTILIKTYESYEKANALYEQLKRDGYDANIISSEANNRVTSFQVTVGAFKNRRDAEAFVASNLEGRHYNIPK